MKNIKISFVLIAAIISFTPVAETKAQNVAISFSTFQQTLNPYGRWMNNPRFGQVWINNDAAFRPYYTNGHWEYTNYGWSWISDYDWGWAPFHYGRWEYDPFYGWMWIPGYEWGAAWVSWSSYGDYYGWAPLGYGIGINVSFGSIPYDRWTFIPRRNICDRDINRYYVSHVQNNNFRNAVVINNYYNGRGNIGRYMRGPQRREAERYTGNRIQERRIDYTDRNRNRNNTSANANDNNRNGRRNNDAIRPDNNNNAGNGNNRRRNDANINSNADVNTQPGNDNSRNKKFKNRQGRNESGEVVPGNNPQTNNRLRNRNVKPEDKNTNTTPPVYENPRPNAGIKPLPQNNENNNPGTRPNDNRLNRNNDQQNNFQQRRQNTRPVPQQQNTRPVPQQQRQPAMQPQQQNTRPAPQQPQMNRPAPQQQQNTRPAPQQQQRQPAMQQRRVDANTGGRNIQQAGGSSQRQNSFGKRNNQD